MSEDKTTIDQDDVIQAEATAQTEQESTVEAAGAADLMSELERWKATAEENNNRALRALADMENMRRRYRKEQEDLVKYASLQVVESLLPVLDNFERALSADQSTLTVESLLEGVSMVYRQMVQVFEKEGLSVIEAIGKPFDPHVHQAVMQVEDPAYESGIVTEELQKGYQFKDRTIRPSMVKVNA